MNPLSKDRSRLTYYYSLNENISYLDIYGCQIILKMLEEYIKYYFNFTKLNLNIF
jgi:hypothetical protein